MSVGAYRRETAPGHQPGRAEFRRLPLGGVGASPPPSPGSPTHGVPMATRVGPVYNVTVFPAQQNQSPFSATVGGSPHSYHGNARHKAATPHGPWEYHGLPTCDPSGCRDDVTRGGNHVRESPRGGRRGGVSRGGAARVTPTGTPRAVPHVMGRQPQQPPPPTPPRQRPAPGYDPPRAPAVSLPPAAPEPWLCHYDPYQDAMYAADPLLPGIGLDPPSPGHHGEAPPPLQELGAAYRTLHEQQQRAQGNWSVDYQDFCPRLTGYNDRNVQCAETFPDLANHANSWLRQNPHVKVTCCETVTWYTSSLVEVGNTETMVLDRNSTPPEGSLVGDVYYLFGLRLWVVPRKCSGPPQVLYFRDYLANENETLSQLTKRVNNNLAEDPLSGSIISSETVLVPNFRSWNTFRLYWRESQCSQPTFNIFIRICYTEGPCCLQSIGVRTLEPELVRGQYESFSLLMRRASRWAASEQGVHITNLKSVYCSRHNDESALVSVDRCTHYFMDFPTQNYFLALRIFYVQRPTVCEHKQVINCMTFTPVQITLGPSIGAGFEKLKPTMMRIATWVELSGSDVFSMESFVTPLVTNSPNHMLPEMTCWNPSMLSAKDKSRRFLFHIRVYINGDFKEPDPLLLPPLPYSLRLAFQTSMEEREYKRAEKQRRMHKTKGRIAIGLMVVMVIVIGGFIILERGFHVFGL